MEPVVPEAFVEEVWRRVLLKEGLLVLPVLAAVKLGLQLVDLFIYSFIPRTRSDLIITQRGNWGGEVKILPLL